VIHLVRPLVLLRGHVGRAAERRAGAREGEIAGRIADDAGDAEVNDLDPAVGVEQDVFRFDVAVPDPARVRGSCRASQIPGTTASACSG
jgi:hypothetical protein